MASTGSISLSGLLGGTAGQIDTTSLINQLMAAQAIPQSELKDQLATLQNQQGAYQAINTKIAAVQTAAQALTDPTAWQATAATSSSSAVAATSSAGAAVGSTTFSVTQLARAQVTTVAADSSGTVVSVPSAGISVTDSAGVVHPIPLTGGSATAVAAAINSAGIGVRASVVQTSSGMILQVVSAKTGLANGFTLSGTDSTPATVVGAQDAQVAVGDPQAGGYTVTSPTNTFTGVIPGVTFSVNSVASDVTVSVGSDQQAISDKVKALVDAANAALSEVSTDTAKGAVLQGRYDARAAGTAIASAVSAGTSAGQSLKSWGIDLDSKGQMSFDPTAFAAAYAADPAGTQTAVAGSFATALNTAATTAVAPVTGTITATLAAMTTRSTDLNDEINTWTDRLSSVRSGLQLKYAAMETALAKLQSQSTYLSSMFNNLNSSSSSSSSSAA